MQTSDEVTGGVTPQYTGRRFPEETLRHYSMPKRIVAVAAAWLVPGAGHLVLGRFGRAALFFFVIAGSFIFGLTLKGRLFWPAAAESSGTFSFDLITVLWFFAQIGSGLCYLLSYALGFGTNPQPQAATYDYGNTFMILAGLLNYLVVHDAFDIGAGRKR